MWGRNLFTRLIPIKIERIDDILSATVVHAYYFDYELIAGIKVDFETSILN